MSKMTLPPPLLTLEFQSVAELIPRLFDDVGPLVQPHTLPVQYESVWTADQEFRRIVQNSIPAYLIQEDDTGLLPSWLDVARRSLAMTAADKVSAKLPRSG